MTRGSFPSRPCPIQIGKNSIQEEGVDAFLKTIRDSSNSTLQCLDLDGITITLQIAKTLKEMEKTHSHLSIPHGGTGGYKELKPRLQPLEKLVKYAKENNVQLIDLFRSFDKEQTRVLPEEEFRNALKVGRDSLYCFARERK